MKIVYHDVNKVSVLFLCTGEAIQICIVNCSRSYSGFITFNFSVMKHCCRTGTPIFFGTSLMKDEWAVHCFLLVIDYSISYCAQLAPLLLFPPLFIYLFLSCYDSHEDLVLFLYNLFFLLQFIWFVGAYKPKQLSSVKISRDLVVAFLINVGIAHQQQINKQSHCSMLFHSLLERNFYLMCIVLHHSYFGSVIGECCLGYVFYSDLDKM